LILRHLNGLLPRVVVLAALIIVATAAGALPGRGSQPTSANAIYGNLALNPPSKFIIQGYKFNIATWLTTCAPNTPGVPDNTWCQVGAYDVNLNYDPAKFVVVSDAGTSSGGNTSTTLKDTTKSWKQNQWAGSRVAITGGTASGEDRLIVSNTSNTLTVSAAWDAFPGNPDATSTYTVGGMTNGGFLGSSGRPVTCPVGPAYGTGWAELHCVTLGDPSTPGANGNGPLTNLTLQAVGRGLMSFTFTLTGVTATKVLKVDATEIPIDIYQTGKRRVTLCPDPNADGKVNIIDISLMAQAFNKKTGQPGYTVEKDPDENGVINTTDMLIAAGEFNLRCIQL